MIAGKCNQKPKGFFRPEDQKSPASVWLGLNSILSRQLQPINPHAEKVPGNDNCKQNKKCICLRKPSTMSEYFWNETYSS